MLKLRSISIFSFTILLWSVFLSMSPAKAFVILPSSCRGDLQTYCLEEHNLEYIFIYGDITWEDDWFFKQLDKKWPETVPLPIIYLESHGGVSQVAMSIGRILHKRHAVVATGNPITETDGYECNSACALLAAGATERHLNAVGFHRTYEIHNYCKTNQWYKSSSQDYEKTIVQYYEEVGADPRVIQYAQGTPYTEMKRLYYDKEMDFKPQIISEIAYQIGPTQSYLTNGFRKADIVYKELKRDDIYEFAIAEGSSYAITEYVDFLTCEAKGHIPEYQKAEAVLRREIGAHDPEIIYQLGKLYESSHIEGIGYTAAVKLYLKGADLHYAPSENRLGWAYYDGHGVKRDYKQALEWFKKSVEQDYYEAYGSMCKVYMEAKAVHPNDVKRYKWCDLAVSKLFEGELKDFAVDAIRHLTLHRAVH